MADEKQKSWTDYLRKWPLLIVGLMCLGWAMTLADRDDPSDMRALLLGVGAVIVGTGLTLVVLGFDDSRHRHRHNDHQHEEDKQKESDAQETPDNEE